MVGGSGGEAGLAKDFDDEEIILLEINCKILSGRLEEAFITRGKLLSDSQQEQTNISNEYIVKFTPASTNNWLPSIYNLHLRNQRTEATKVVIVARIVQNGGGGKEGMEEEMKYQELLEFDP